MSVPRIGWRVALLIVGSLAVSLAIDVHVGYIGQIAAGLPIWVMFFYLLTRVGPGERDALMVCLVIATLGEIFLSLGWGLYTYRLENIPFFVPPGHVILFTLGLWLAPRMPRWFPAFVGAAALLYAIVAVTTGFDTFAALIVAVLAIVIRCTPQQHRPLYATTFMIALALELYGTWLGNWSWHAAVPFTPFVTVNPPGLSGAFYCVLDALIAVVVAARFASVAGASLGDTGGTAGMLHLDQR